MHNSNMTHKYLTYRQVFFKVTRGKEGIGVWFFFVFFFLLLSFGANR